MTSPYADLPADAFWRTGVAQRPGTEAGKLYTARHRITAKTRLATAGSCFAQRIGGWLSAAGCRVIDTETVPRTIPTEVAQKYGYRQFSARYGNIYTARHFCQLIQEAFGQFEPVDAIWEKDGRFYDAMRPRAEPEGLESPADVIAHRIAHLEQVRRAMTLADVLVFTFGLTECWLHRASGTVYPTAPGTVVGRYDPSAHAFHNCGFPETLQAFETARALLHKHNPGLRFILTVTPQPITATATGQHVEVADAQTKANLRAVCGELYSRYPDVDYFPSFELALSRKARDGRFGKNMRTLTPAALDKIMAMFFDAHGLPRKRAEATGPDQAAQSGPPPDPEDLDEEDCEDILLEAFAK